MQTDPTVPPHKCSPSHTAIGQRRKITPPPQAKDHSAPKAHLLPLPLRKPVTLTLSYRGGAEGWVEVRARGAIWRFPGSTAIHDICLLVHGHHLT